MKLLKTLFIFFEIRSGVFIWLSYETSARISDVELLWKSWDCEQSELFSNEGREVCIYLVFLQIWHLRYIKM